MSNKQVSSRFSQDVRNPEQKRGLRIGRTLERELHINGTLERCDELCHRKATCPGQVILDLPGLELERCGQLTTLSARIERLGDDKLADAAAQQRVSPHIALGGQ